jgi:hypothetical protein
MKKYTTVDTSTLKGLERAERLKAKGWRIDRVGLFLVMFSKEVKREGEKGIETHSRNHLLRDR